MCIFQHWQAIVEECSLAKGVWPQGKVHCFRPVRASVDQLLECTLREVPNGLLDNAILEVHIYDTKGKLLLRIVAGLLEGIVVELPFVAVVVLDSHTVLGGVLLEGAFGSSCLHG